MARTLTRPMFRKGGMARREEYMGGGIKTVRPKYMGGGMTGIMSGIVPDAGLTPRTGFQTGESFAQIQEKNRIKQEIQNKSPFLTPQQIEDEYNKYVEGLEDQTGMLMGIDEEGPGTFLEGVQTDLGTARSEEGKKAFIADLTAKEKAKEQELISKGIIPADKSVFKDKDSELDDVDTLDTKDTVETTKDKFRRIFDEYLPVIEEQLKPDEDAARRDRYLALAKFGAGLAAQPGGDLVGAIGKAAEKPISDLSRISAQQRKEKQTPKMLALQAALSQMDNKGKTATEIGIDAQRVDSIAKDISGRSELGYETAYGVAEKLDKLRREGSPLAGKFTSQYPKDPKKVAKIKEAKYFYTTDGALKVVENGLTYSVSEWEQELKKRKKTKKA